MKLVELKKWKTEMDDYQSEVIKKRDKLRTMEKKYEKMKLKHREDIDRISVIMSRTETEVIKDLVVSKYEYEPVRATGDRKISSVTITDTLLKVKALRYVGEGEYWRFSVKIPLVYFDMTEEEIKKAHTEWSYNIIMKKEDAKNVKALTKKKELYNTLKKELGE